MKKIILSVLALIIALMSTAVAVFGWLAVGTSIGSDLGLSGSVLSTYFASGDGSEASPYEINRPNHLYNFSWLQNNGYFTTQNYFKITANLNMSGYVLPPIGTKTNPFIGILDGGSKTITNLTVSNVEKASTMLNEVSPIPSNMKDKIGNGSTDIVGFFGVIGHYPGGSCPKYNNKISVSNLYLDNLTVRTRTTNSLIGLFAGYVCGNVSNVGVYRSMVSIGAGVSTLSNSYTAHSKYSLIGDYDSKNTNWTDGVGNSVGGDLKIDPNDSGDVFTTVNDGYYRAITGSVQNTAFFVGYLKASPISGGVKGQYLYNGTISTDKSIEYTAGIKNTQSIANIEVSGTTIDVRNANIYIEPAAANISTTNNTTTYLTDVLKVNLGTETTSLPKNGIWFKPSSYGDCYIAFCQQNQSSSSCMSIYKFKRNSDGTINQSIIITTFILSIGKNKGVCFFNYPISKQDLADGYEYFIGKTNNKSTTAGFVYLVLAGTNVSDGSAEGRSIVNIKFVYKESDSAAEYKTLNDFYAFEIIRSGTTSGVQIYFLMTSGGMFYYIDPTYDTANTQVNLTNNALSATTNDSSLKTNYGGTKQPPS